MMLQSGECQVLFYNAFYTNVCHINNKKAILRKESS